VLLKHKKCDLKMEILSIVLQLILCLSILVVLHEFGHYLPAKWFKTRVEKFYLFFNPRFSLYKKQIGETEWGIGWVPFGGYVKIAGMIDESMDKEQMKQPEQPWEFRAKPAWQRLIIMIGGVVVNFLLGFFIYAMLLFTYGESYFKNEDLKYGVAVDSLGMKLGLQDGDNIISIGDTKVDRYSPSLLVKEIAINGATKFVVKRDGSEITLDIPEGMQKMLTSSSYKNKTGYYPRYPMQVKEVSKNSIAENAGIKPNDFIVKVNNNVTFFSNDFASEIRKHKNELINITIHRPNAANGTDTIISQVQMDSTSLIGVSMQDISKFISPSKDEYSFLAALPAGVKKGINFLDMQIKAFSQMFKGKMDAKENLGSVISMAKLFDSSWNWERFWSITAMLSIILAFFNILPIPALDGGYVLFLLWEIITGKKPSDRFMEIVTTVGFFILITLMIYVLGLDITKLFK
jgi:regulator of sigma E protease